MAKYADKFGNRDVTHPVTLKDWAETLVEHKVFKMVQPVYGDIGPIDEAFGNGDGGPRVIFGADDTFCMVWVERLPDGWRDPMQTWRSDEAGKAVAYAKKLAETIRAAAVSRLELREKMKLVRRCEREGGLESTNWIITDGEAGE